MIVKRLDKQIDQELTKALKFCLVSQKSVDEFKSGNRGKKALREIFREVNKNVAAHKQVAADLWLHVNEMRRINFTSDGEIDFYHLRTAARRTMCEFVDLVIDDDLESWREAYDALDLLCAIISSQIHEGGLVVDKKSKLG